ncbi:hypothetical protein K461DRAFT_266239 [Myriangium duriaei CBS 260.36]|uniref:Uncharacterized protein n=1 Tax=Myriangium duriaei CBS 260.36 TaxID=1168546 RepID=A0A9P4MJ54_9PEZI|nr:hypothetical protein K461DRAFT_266239 [Myriangium duriaei CBS 260.36]
MAGVSQPIMHLLILAIAAAPPVTAKPLMENLRQLDFNDLFARSNCANPCGWSGQLCCSSSQYCYTDSNGQAQCGNNAGSGGSGSNGGYWTTWTSTYVQTDLITVTSIGSSYVGTPATAAPQPTASCDYKLNQVSCGTICCASNQYCASPNQCAAAANGGSSGVYASSFATSTTAGFLPPLRPTDSTLVTVTSTGSHGPTVTQSFLAPVATGANVTIGTLTQSSHSGLSGGAIAGIVIGVLLGIALLFLICFYLILRGLFNGILALLGFGKRDRRRERETEVIEEYHHSHRGRDDRSYYSGAGGSRGRPARVERKVERRSSGVGKEALGVAGALAGLAAVLGFKRSQDKKRREREEKMSYYTEDSMVSDVTSASEFT